MLNTNHWANILGPNLAGKEKPLRDQPATVFTLGYLTNVYPRWTSLPELAMLDFFEGSSFEQLRKTISTLSQKGLIDMRFPDPTRKRGAGAHREYRLKKQDAQ